jgi:D-alanyl-D-alanine carboxypeptidase
MNLERKQLSRRAFLRGGAIVSLTGFGAVLLSRNGAEASATLLASRGTLPAARLQALLDQQVQAGVAGMVLHIDTADGATWTGAAGVRRLRGDSMTADTLFPTFSVAKLAMATAALRMDEDGVLSLDDKISKHLGPALVASLPHADGITVRHLVRHTSGFRDYFDPSFIGMLWENPGRRWSPEELVAHAANGEPAGLPDDGDADYSNTNYVLLGLVMQQATGQPLAQVLRQRVLNPLRMSQTSSWEEDTLRYEVAGYMTMDGDTIEVDGLDLSMSWGCGGLVSTAADMARLSRGMLTGDLLSKDTQHEVLNHFGPMKDREQEYGYAVSRYEWAGATLLGATGEFPGYTVASFYEPSTGNAYAILTNVFDDTWQDTLAKALAILKS